MSIVAKRVAANVNNSTATVEYYSPDAHITVTINGCTCNFPAHYNSADNATVDTILALKEAVAEL